MDDSPSSFVVVLQSLNHPHVMMLNSSQPGKRRNKEDWFLQRGETDFFFFLFLAEDNYDSQHSVWYEEILVICYLICVVPARIILTKYC